MEREYLYDMKKLILIASLLFSLNSWAEETLLKCIDWFR